MGWGWWGAGRGGRVGGGVRGSGLVLLVVHRCENTPSLFFLPCNGVFAAELKRGRKKHIIIFKQLFGCCTDGKKLKPCVLWDAE
jgi:hypothetical protein